MQSISTVEADSKVILLLVNLYVQLLPAYSIHKQLSECVNKENQSGKRVLSRSPQWLAILCRSYSPEISTSTYISILKIIALSIMLQAFKNCNVARIWVLMTKVSSRYHMSPFWRLRRAAVFLGTRSSHLKPWYRSSHCFWTLKNLCRLLPVSLSIFKIFLLHL